MTRRSNGHGSFYFVAQSGCYRAAVSVGGRKRKTRHFRTREEAEAWIANWREYEGCYAGAIEISAEDRTALVQAIEDAKDASGYVYAIHAPEVRRIKIGYTADVPLRLLQVKSISPVEIEIMGIVPGSRQLEGKLHSVFRELRHHGEWFTEARTLREFILSEFISYERWALRWWSEKEIAKFERRSQRRKEREEREEQIVRTIEAMDAEEAQGMADA